jgi:hypothetical protein
MKEPIQTPATPRSKQHPSLTSNAGKQQAYSQSSSSLLSSSTLPASFGLLGAWLGTPDVAPTTS